MPYLMPHHRISWLVLLFLCFASQLSFADVLPEVGESKILAQEYWVDNSRALTLEEVKHQNFTPFEHQLSIGYKKGATWIQLTLPPLKERAALIIYPTWLDRLEIYDPTLRATPIILGDHVSIKENAFRTVALNQWLEPWLEPRQIWIRLTTVSTHAFYAKLVPNHEIPSQATAMLILPIVYVVSLLAILIGLAAIFLVQKDSITGSFLLRHTSFTWYVLSYLGFLPLIFGDLAPAGFYNLNFSFIALAVLPISVWFDLRLLSHYQASKVILLLIKLSIPVSILLISIFFFIDQRTALNSNILLLMITSVLAFVGSLTTQAKSEANTLLTRYAVISYYGLFFISLIFSSFGLLGLIKTYPWISYMLVTTGVLTSSLMLIFLYMRSRRAAVQAMQSHMELAQTRIDLEREHQQREEQSYFLYMLMHELKTPLSVLSLIHSNDASSLKQQKQANHAVHEMKAILERCLEVDYLENQKVQIQINRVDLSALLTELINHLPVQAEIQLDNQAEATDINTDSRILFTILNNLIQNAARYSLANEPVLVRLVKAENQNTPGVEIQIVNRPSHDDWPDPTRVFTKYYRSLQAQRLSGSGLGLYLAHQLSKLISAQLTYTPNQQAVIFTLWLPEKIH